MTDELETLLDQIALHSGRPRRFADPATLSPAARELYDSTLLTNQSIWMSQHPTSPNEPIDIETRDRWAEEQSRSMWLEYRDYYVLDDDGNAVEAPLVEWATMYDGPNRAKRQIRRDHIGNWLISTVFLGLDHGFGLFDKSDDTQPVLWETMIFYTGRRRRYNPALHEGMWRYTSTTEAIEGHARAVMYVQAYRNGPRKLKKFLQRRKGRVLAQRYAGLLQKLDL